MQPDQTFPNDPSARQSAVGALAIVGFIALVAAGIYLAVYSARFVPNAVSGLGTAAVSLSSLFHSSSPNIATIPPVVGSSTLPVISATSTSASTTPVKKPVYTVPRRAGQETNGTYQIDGSAATSNYSGLPDLAVSITSVGYINADGSASTFVASPTVPSGYLPAVQFTVNNIGTNTAGPWSFSASIPTVNSYVYDSVPQQPLNPGDSIDYTLGFDEPNLGNQNITVDVNYNKDIPESNYTNDTASIGIDIE